VSNAIFSSMDFMPTFARLAGCNVPGDRIIDGVDQTELLLGKSNEGARTDFYYFCKNELYGVRKGKWKLMLPDREVFRGYVKDRVTKEVELYNLESDIGEKNNLAEQHPETVSELLNYAKMFKMPEILPPTNIRIE